MEFKWSLLVFTYIQLLPFDYDCILQHESTRHLEEEVRRIGSLHVMRTNISRLFVWQIYLGIFLNILYIYIYMYFLITKDLRLKLCRYLTKVLIF